LRPRRTKYRKAHKGYFKTKSGGSLRGTRVYYGEYGLQAAEGGRIRDKQLDNVKACVRLVMKSEKGAKLILRAFPDRPVTAKGAETRMGKGKGTVDYYATWVSEGRILFEIRGLPETSALEAFRIASQSLPIRTRVV
ncbi:ribosomal protein L10e/L16, partial [Polychytrium aggregatum]|uniref:ribosomal protein L10e/L16 n=1 Tax=Polychytrium aggregatum TaxID=110093 RepID=UPI0022FDF09D